MSGSALPGPLHRVEIPAAAYLRFAFELSGDEAAFREECLSRLPATIFDAHSHANGAAAYMGLSEYGRAQVRSSFPCWSLEDSRGVRELTYGTRQVRFLRFAQPYRGIDHRAANAYLLRHAPAGDLLALCGLPDDPEYTIGQLRSGRWTALKMYPHYQEPPATRLAEYFPDQITATAAELRIPLILHPHAPITACLPEVLELAGRHPGIRIMLAHLGREFAGHARLAPAWAALSAIPGLVADTSMVCDSAVIAAAIDGLGPDRVLYGSDEPCNLLRYARYRHPELGPRLSSDYPYHWLREDLRRDYGHLGAGAWLSHFQSLRAVLGAIDARAGSSAEALIRAIFHDNAARFLTGVAAPVPGPVP